jgi:hypothetical protein
MLSDWVIIRIKFHFRERNLALHFPNLFLPAAANAAAPVFTDETVCRAPVFTKALFGLILVVGSLPGYGDTLVICRHRFSFTSPISIFIYITKITITINILFLQHYFSMQLVCLQHLTQIRSSVDSINRMGLNAKMRKNHIHTQTADSRRVHV